MFGSKSPGSAPSLGNTSSGGIQHGIAPAFQFPCVENGSNKRKRRPAGTPDPDAEVVSLSPKTLLESDRYVCEICNQGFQRDQNLQMHRRRHKVPWKLLKRETPEVRKRVFVCPEPSCLHHDPCHALGDLVGIKKHFRRKHSNHKQWTCEKCSKGYAVQSDYKAHLKTCGTRGHSCDCGRVFSRVESFIEHQDACNAGSYRPELQTPQPACLSRTTSSPSQSIETNFSASAWSALRFPTTVFIHPERNPATDQPHNLELQLLPSSNTFQSTIPKDSDLTPDENQATKLQLSIGFFNEPDKHQSSNPGFSWVSMDNKENSGGSPGNLPSDKKSGEYMVSVMKLKSQAREQLRLAAAEKAYAEEAWQQAKRQIELAELEFANAKRIRQQAQAELEKAQILKDQATKQINSTILQITCQACKQQFQAAPTPDENSLAMSYMSSAVTEGEGENDNRHHLLANISTI